MANSVKSHVNGKDGKIILTPTPDGIVVTQERNGIACGNIILSPEDMEKLAKALFAKKKEMFPPAPPPSTHAVPSIQPPKPNAPAAGTGGSSYMAQQKALHKNAYGRWSEDDDNLLRKYHDLGLSVPETATLLGRNDGAIASRKNKLGLS